MNFQASVDYLYGLGNEVTAMKLGLENIRTLLAALGDPQNKYKKVQVAGTNGKGSVCAFIDSICNAAGIKTGLYTSPHLISVTERMKVNGENITDIDFARIATDVREMSERLVKKRDIESVPTFFEQVTAIALLAFADAKVELAILETGLGGRLDATTAANAEIAAITRIDYDHQNYLGNTIAEIAIEKAAIIRTGVSVVIASQSSEVEQIISERCRVVGVAPVWARANMDMVDQNAGPLNLNRGITFSTANNVHLNIRLGLEGKHQIGNAAVATGLAELLREKNFAITNDQIRIGLESTRHPGRLEYAGSFLFDGAHNLAGANALREYLDEVVRQPITLVFGGMNDKNIFGIANSLFPIAETIILTQPENSRAMPASEIAAFVPANVDRRRVFITTTVARAIEIAIEMTPADGLILVTGSLYLVGEAKKILNN